MPLLTIIPFFPNSSSAFGMPPATGSTNIFGQPQQQTGQQQSNLFATVDYGWIIWIDYTVPTNDRWTVWIYTVSTNDRWIIWIYDTVSANYRWNVRLDSTAIRWISLWERSAAAAATANWPIWLQHDPYVQPFTAPGYPTRQRIRCVDNDGSRRIWCKHTIWEQAASTTTATMAVSYANLNSLIFDNLLASAGQIKTFLSKI